MYIFRLTFFFTTHTSSTGAFCDYLHEDGQHHTIPVAPYAPQQDIDDADGGNIESYPIGKNDSFQADLVLAMELLIHEKKRAMDLEIDNTPIPAKKTIVDEEKYFGSICIYIYIYIYI